MSRALQSGQKFYSWDGRTVVAWLEEWVGVPFWFVAALKGALKSGATLAVSAPYM